MPADDADSARAQLLYIKREQRNDHQQSDHVDEGRDHQGEQLRRNLSHFFVEDIEEGNRNRAEQHAHEWRLKGLADVLLDQKHPRLVWWKHHTLTKSVSVVKSCELCGGAGDGTDLAWTWTTWTWWTTWTSWTTWTWWTWWTTHRAVHNVHVVHNVHAVHVRRGGREILL